jgi:hypothetical protein
MRWLKDPKVEANLRRLGIKFEIETGILMLNIDREEGMRRQVRLAGKLTDDVITPKGREHVLHSHGVWGSMTAELYLGLLHKQLKIQVNTL